MLVEILDSSALLQVLKGKRKSSLECIPSILTTMLLQTRRGSVWLHYNILVVAVLRSWNGQSDCVLHSSPTSLPTCFLCTGMMDAWNIQWTLVVGVDHDVTLHTLLPLVGKGVATAPVALASGTTKLTKHLLALVGGFLHTI